MGNYPNSANTEQKIEKKKEDYSHKGSNCQRANCAKPKLDEQGWHSSGRTKSMTYKRMNKIRIIVTIIYSNLS